MKFSLLMIVLVAVFMLATPVSAQMMGVVQQATTSSTQTQTLQDEAVGKAIWDKLQDNKLTCSDLKDDDFDVLGDFFMGNMAGSNHDAMNQMMTQRLGADGQKQMHIALGKRQSGCDANAAFPQGASYFAPMMGSTTGMMNTTTTSQWTNGTNTMMGTAFGIFRVLAGILILTFLTLGIAFFWKELRKTKLK